MGQRGAQNAIHDISTRDIEHFGTDANRSRSTRAQKMPINVLKPPQVEFPAPKYPIDIANVASRDARCARERYLAKRFRLTPEHAAAVASLVFGEPR